MIIVVLNPGLIKYCHAKTKQQDSQYNPLPTDDAYMSPWQVKG